GEVVDVVEVVGHADRALPARAWGAGELGDAGGLRRSRVAVAGDRHGAVDLTLAGAPEERGRERRRMGASRRTGQAGGRLARCVGGGRRRDLGIEVAAIGGEVLPGARGVAVVAARRQLGDPGARALDPIRDALLRHLLEVVLHARLAVLAELLRRGD